MGIELHKPPLDDSSTGIELQEQRPHEGDYRREHKPGSCVRTLASKPEP